MSGQHEWCDAEALARLRTDPEAAGVLYDRHICRLVHTLARQCGDEQVALDAAQETFARLLTSRRTVQASADGSAWPWLAVTGRNIIYDWGRRGRVDAAARRRLGIATPPPSGDAIDDALERTDAVRLRHPIAAALAGLPAAQRVAVTERVIRDRSYADIAAASDATEQTVRRRASRGLRSMSAILKRSYP